MGHGYVRNRFGCNCFYGDSSFKRYNRAHGDTVIFQNYYGNNNHCCGGGRRVGFWGGFGAVLGFGLGNMVMGGLNMLGGWLGLGNGGYMGGGYSTPWGGSYGGGWQTGNNGYNTGWNNNRTNSTTTNNSTTTPQKENIDTDKISNFLTEIDELNKNPDASKIADLKNRIQKAKTNADDIKTQADSNSYDRLLNILDGIEKRVNSQPVQQPATQGNGGAQQTPTPTTGAGATTTPTTAANTPVAQGSTPTTGNNTPATANEQINIGGKPRNIDTISNISDLKGLTRDDINDLDKKVAEKILDKLGYTDGTGNNKVGKLSNNFEVLLLLEKSALNVEVEHRKDSDDQWIKGPITNVQQNDGIISYDVDCNGVTGALYGAKYTFVQEQGSKDEYTCYLAKGNTVTGIKVDNTIKLKFIGEKEALRNESGQPLVTK